MNLRDAVRRLPHIAWRDRRINQLLQEREELRRLAELSNQTPSHSNFEPLGHRLQATPSFHIRNILLSRTYAAGKRAGTRHPIWALDKKTSGYEFAIAHGFDTPAILGFYNRITDVAWSELPDNFVIKSNRGASSRGVIPLVRTTADKYLDLLNVDEGPMPLERLLTRFQAARATGKIGDEVAIEELIVSPYDQDGRTLPPDIKMYCFYGCVGLVMVRMTNGSRKQSDFTMRYFDDHGDDLGDVMPSRRIDDSITRPRHFDKLIDASSVLSKALHVPFVRVDFYERIDSIVFGEITPLPGGLQLPRADVDRKLGQLWEDAEARLAHDLTSYVLPPQHVQHS